MMNNSMLHPSAARHPFAGPHAARTACTGQQRSVLACAGGSRDTSECALIGRRLALTAALLGTLARQVSAAEGEGAPVPVYFGNGCFWGRQKDFVDAEKALGRSGEQITAVSGYAGGIGGQGGPVCYYTGKPGTVYEDLGHAEVVKLELDADTEAARREMERFATTYFSQFQRTRNGMQRLDPQDAGPAYRNVVGLPGGVNSPLFEILKEKNVHGMRLVAGEGNAPGKLKEGDVINTVYVMDTNVAPFNPAEFFHQYHQGIGASFGAEYLKKQKAAAQRAGRIGPTGCPEIRSFF